MNGIFPHQKSMRGKEFKLGKKNARSSGINVYSSDNRADSGIRGGRAEEKESRNTGVKTEILRDGDRKCTNVA